LWIVLWIELVKRKCFKYNPIPIHHENGA